MVDCLEQIPRIQCVPFIFVITMNDSKEFWLYDLKVEVISTQKPMVCDHQPGQYFLMHGENLLFGPDGKFPLYPLAALLPLLPAKQRPTDEHDWMTTDACIACPDPHCGGQFRITRTGKRRFTHAETSGLPDKRGTPHWATSAASDD